MNPHQLHTNSATHTHDFPFYDYRRGEDVGREHVRECDLLNTIMSFPSTSTQPFLLPRSSLQERLPGNFFIQGSTSSPVSFDVTGANRDEREQLINSRGVCESSVSSTMGSSGTDKLREKQPLAGIDTRYGAGQSNVLARFSSDSPSIADGEGRAGGLWPFSDRTDCIRNNISETSGSSLQLPISTMRLGEDLRSFSGAGQSIVPTMLHASGDPGGGGAAYASSAQCRDGMWADDHGTELLLLPGTSGVGSSSHHQNIPHAQSQTGRTGGSVLINNLKPLNEYLHMHSSDRVREQNPNFHSYSTYGTASGSSLRDLSLSLSAQENSQQVLYGRGSGSLTGVGSARTNLQNCPYLKAAQTMLAEVCTKAIAEGLAGNFPSYNNAGLVNALVSSDLNSARMEEVQVRAGSSDQSSSLHSMQPLRSSFDQVQEVPAAMAHLQLQDHPMILAARQQNDHLQVAPFMDRSQVELKRRRLFIMLEELEKRYKRYEEQMQVLIIALETSGVGLMLEGAAPYKEVAGQAIHKRFTYLRDAILASETFIVGGYSGDGAGSSHHHLPGAGECDQAGTAAATRFRLLDQQLRHQRALQQVGLFPQPPWRPQRGLPERSVSLLRAWLFDHFLHPYPKDTEKVLLARQTGLTRNQVSNWFINARVRLWKPMVEEMYQEEMKTAELRRTSGQGNAKKFIPTSTHSSRNTTGTSEFHLDQSKKHALPDFGNQVVTMQDLGSMSAMQGMAETSRFFYKQNEMIGGHNSQSRVFQSHQDEQVSFATSMELPAGKAMGTMLDAAQQCGTHTWPFIQHQSVSFDAQEQQHYCNSDISAALMRFGSTGGVTLTLGLQQHSSGGSGGGGGGGGGGSGGGMNCAGPSPFERSSDDVNAAHRWCE